jgi:hypothetical protein
MTAQEALKRNEKSQWLKVWQVDDTWFYVESEDGKIDIKICLILFMLRYLITCPYHNLKQPRGILNTFSG